MHGEHFQIPRLLHKRIDLGENAHPKLRQYHHRHRGRGSAVGVMMRSMIAYKSYSSEANGDAQRTEDGTQNTSKTNMRRISLAKQPIVAMVPPPQPWLH